MAATVWYDGMGATHSEDVLRAHYEVDLDAESCRSINNRGCTGFDRITGARYIPPNVIAEMRLRQGRIGEALVIMAGYDDWDINSGIDAVMAEARAQGVPRVVWLTYRTTTSYILPGHISAAGLYERQNQVLRAKAEQYPSLVIADWDAATKSQCDNPRTAAGAPGQRDTPVTTDCWFWWDGIHLTPKGAVALTTWISGQLDGLFTPRCRSGEVAGSPAAPGASSAAETAPLGFAPSATTRVLDTRSGSILGGGRFVSIDLSGRVPDGAEAAVINVAATDPCGDGYLTAYSCDTGVPATSTVNYFTQRTVTNTAIVRLGGDHHLCVFASADTDAAVDVTGWFTRGGSPFSPVTPVRAVDTRAGAAALASLGGRRTAGSDIEVPLAGVVPPDATGAWIGVVAVNPDRTGHVSIHPCGQEAVTSTIEVRPDTAAGRIVPNAALATLSGGRTCLATTTGTDVVIDVFGWFGPGGKLHLVASGPTRVIDTRTAGTGPLLADRLLRLPPTAQTDVVNLTAVQPLGPGFVSVYPCGPVPLVSNVNTALLVNRPVLALASPGQGGQACVAASLPTHVIVDRLATFR